LIWERPSIACAGSAQESVLYENVCSPSLSICVQIGAQGGGSETKAGGVDAAESDYPSTEGILRPMAAAAFASVSVSCPLVLFPNTH